MKNNPLINVALWVLLGIGFLGGLSISYNNLMGSHCPHLGPVPICYLVTLAYGAMIVSVLVRHTGCRHYFFIAGWGVATLVALVGTGAELALGGGVCPVSGGGGIRGGEVAAVGIPMCYLSLALLVGILLLFLAGPYRRACDAFNAD